MARRNFSGPEQPCLGGDLRVSIYSQVLDGTYQAATCVTNEETKQIQD